MEKIKVKIIIGMLNKLFTFIYALSLAYGKLPVMEGKSIFIQFIPMAIALIVAILCES